MSATSQVSSRRNLLLQAHLCLHDAFIVCLLRRTLSQPHSRSTASRGITLPLRPPGPRGSESVGHRAAALLPGAPAAAASLAGAGQYELPRIKATAAAAKGDGQSHDAPLPGRTVPAVPWWVLCSVSIFYPSFLLRLWR